MLWDWLSSPHLKCLRHSDAHVMPESTSPFHVVWRLSWYHINSLWTGVTDFRKTGVFTGGTDDSQSMFVCEHSTLHELSAGLTKPCNCWAVAWVLSWSVQVQLSNFDFLYNSSILIRLDTSFVLNFIVEIVWLNSGGPAQEFLASLFS